MAIAGVIATGALTSAIGKRIAISFSDKTMMKKIPWKFGNTGGNMGVTNKFGDITIDPSLSGKDLIETIRHEGVHRFFSPKRSSFQALKRANIRMKAYNTSHLVKYLEEAIAETVGTKSIRKGLTFPLTGYGIDRTQLVVESVGYVGITAGGMYAGYQLNK